MAIMIIIAAIFILRAPTTKELVVLNMSNNTGLRMYPHTPSKKKRYPVMLAILKDEILSIRWE
jgi:hypothetical protein